jgi:hypothetical protein
MRTRTGSAVSFRPPCAPRSPRGKAAYLAFWELLPARCRPQAQLAAQHDQELLALDVVVENHLAARLELVDARAEVLGACARGDSDRSDAIGGHFEGIVEIGHDRSVRPADARSASRNGAKQAARWHRRRAGAFDHDPTAFRSETAADGARRCAAEPAGPGSDVEDVQAFLSLEGT